MKAGAAGPTGWAGGERWGPGQPHSDGALVSEPGIRLRAIGSDSPSRPHLCQREQT